MDHILQVCRERGAQYGIEFGSLEYLSNSRLALEAAEYARDMGVHDAFHKKVFEAYFTHSQNIGDEDILLGLAEDCGLSAAELGATLRDGVYSERVKAGSRMAKQLGVTAIPAFVIEDLPIVTGAVDEVRFREALDTVS